MQRCAATGSRSPLSLRDGHDNIRSTSAILVPLLNPWTFLKSWLLHVVCWLQSGIRDLLNLSTSSTREMDATNFWISIRGFGHGQRWEVSREPTFLIFFGK